LRANVPKNDKAIRLSGHASQQLQFRGASEEEIVEAIQVGTWIPAEHGRIQCRKDFPCNGPWNGKQYATKQVRPIFAEEPDEIVVVTVYVYYF
jgi:hypothetical protein